MRNLYIQANQKIKYTPTFMPSDILYLPIFIFTHSGSEMERSRRYSLERNPFCQFRSLHYHLAVRNYSKIKNQVIWFKNT